MAAAHYVRVCECLTETLNCLLVVEFTGYSVAKQCSEANWLASEQRKELQSPAGMLPAGLAQSQLFLFVARAERIVRIHVGHKLCRVDVFSVTCHRFPHLELGRELGIFIVARA